MAQDLTTSPQRPRASHPRSALQSTPQAKGSATISEHINTVGIHVSDIRPWIARDVDCTNKSVDETYKTRLFEQCLCKVLPIYDGEDHTPVDSMKVMSREVKEALRRYSKIKELYPKFVKAANTALLFLEELEIEDIRSAGDPTLCVHVHDSMMSSLYAAKMSDEDGEPEDIYSQKDRFLRLATKPPNKPEFEWRGIHTFVEFKKAKTSMEPPPERYYSRQYTPPQDKHLTLDIPSEPDLDAFPEELVSSGVDPQPPEPEAMRTSEPEILERVHDIGKDDKLVKGHVPDILWYKAFKDASTDKFRERLGLKTEGARVLYMTIFRPITELTGLDFFHAWWDTVLCHLALWKKQVYHRDISPSNLMYRIDNGKIVGVLNDFDLASTQQSATGTERTGMVPFMALDHLDDLALQGHIIHAYQHDAESFIWVLIWISLRYDDGKPRKHSRPLDAWLRVDAVGCRKEKTDFFYNSEWSSLKAGVGHEENWRLAQECIVALISENLTTLTQRQSPRRFMDVDTAFKTFFSDPGRVVYLL